MSRPVRHGPETEPMTIDPGLYEALVAKYGLPPSPSENTPPSPREEGEEG